MSRQQVLSVSVYIHTYIHTYLLTYVKLQPISNPDPNHGKGTTPAAATMPSAVPRGVSTRGPAPASDLGRAFAVSTHGKVWALGWGRYKSAKTDFTQGCSIEFHTTCCSPMRTEQALFSQDLCLGRDNRQPIAASESPPHCIV